MGAGIRLRGVGDYQLTRFKRIPQCRADHGPRTVGLDAAPNYFGDVCVWVGLWLLALGHPAGLLTVISPLLMGFFLVRVSGKALLEKNMRRTRGRPTTHMWREPAASCRAHRGGPDPVQQCASTSAIACFSLADSHSP